MTPRELAALEAVYKWWTTPGEPSYPNDTAAKALSALVDERLLDILATRLNKLNTSISWDCFTSKQVTEELRSVELALRKYASREPL